MPSLPLVRVPESVRDSVHWVLYFALAIGLAVSGFFLTKADPIEPQHYEVWLPASYQVIADSVTLPSIPLELHDYIAQASPEAKHYLVLASNSDYQGYFVQVHYYYHEDGIAFHATSDPIRSPVGYRSFVPTGKYIPTDERIQDGQLIVNYWFSHSGFLIFLFMMILPVMLGVLYVLKIRPIVNLVIGVREPQ